MAAEAKKERHAKDYTMQLAHRPAAGNIAGAQVASVLQPATTVKQTSKVGWLRTTLGDVRRCEVGWWSVPACAAACEFGALGAHTCITKHNRALLLGALCGKPHPLLCHLSAV